MKDTTHLINGQDNASLDVPRTEAAGAGQVVTHGLADFDLSFGIAIGTRAQGVCTSAEYDEEQDNNVTKNVPAQQSLSPKNGPGSHPRRSMRAAPMD